MSYKNSLLIAVAGAAAATSGLPDHALTGWPPSGYRYRRRRRLSVELSPESQAAYVAEVGEKKTKREHKRLNAGVKSRLGTLRGGCPVQPHLWGLGWHKEWCSVTRPNVTVDCYARVLVAFPEPVDALTAKEKLLEVAPDLDGRMLAVVPKHIHVT